MKSNRVTLICGVCEKSFDVKHSHSKRRTWCSVPCSAIGKRRRRQTQIEQKFNEPIIDLLNRLYHQEKRPMREVANIIGVSTRNLFEWFYDFDIQRRKRSLAVAMQWVDNDDRREKAADTMRKIIPDDLDERRARSAHANKALQDKNGPTSIERIMMDALDNESIIYEFQYLVNNKFLCDFALLDHDLIIECDGQYWHNKPNQIRTDASKDAYLQACGYSVMRFSDTKIRSDIFACISAIKAFI